LARDTAYVGHSASLTRCRFFVDSVPSDLNEAKTPLRRIYPGRFLELRRAFEAGRRPLPGASAVDASKVQRERANLFAERWLMLEHVAGEMPDIRACALVSKAIRDALLSGYKRIGLGGAISE